MGINSFFEDVLGAPFSNRRSTWGAYDKRNNRIFLCLWRDQLLHDDGIRRIAVLNRKFPKKERQLHVDAMRAGCPAYAVICDRRPNKDVITNFDTEHLLVLGPVGGFEGDFVYAQIEGEISIAEVRTLSGGWADVVRDIENIENDTGLDSTTRETLTQARVGQGEYRVSLLKKWDDCCAVTGCSVKEAIRASHAKRWSESTTAERLDPDNGLPLVGTLDILFDAGLIAFDAKGKMLVSPRISPEQRRLLGLSGGLRKKVNHQQSAYLKHHMEHIFNNR